MRHKVGVFLDKKKMDSGIIRTDILKNMPDNRIFFLPSFKSLIMF